MILLYAAFIYMQIPIAQGTYTFGDNIRLTAITYTHSVITYQPCGFYIKNTCKRKCFFSCEYEHYLIFRDNVWCKNYFFECIDKNNLIVYNVTT